MEDTIRMSSRATEKHCEQIFEETKELEEKKSEEALQLVQKKYDLSRYQNERDEARRLRRSGSSRRMKKEADSQDLISCQSCRPSAVDYVEEMSLESPRKIQGRTSVDELRLQGIRREEEEKMREGWNQKKKRRRWKPKLFRTEWKASTWTLMVKVAMGGRK